MKQILKIILAVTIASGLLVGPAAASVQNVTTHTKMTVNDKTVGKGDLVKFKVRLKAGVAKCFKHMPIKLFKNGDQVAKKKTNTEGKVVFKKHPKKTAKWQAKFPGKRVGKHPKR